MKIRGNTVGVPTPRSDWKQDNPNKADYICNKPDLSLMSQGRSAKYNITSPGWKRVLNIIRASGGIINFGIAQSSPLYMCQALGVCFSGFVKYGDDNSTGKNPVLYQMYNNIFGEGDAMNNPGKITAVRIGYPDPEQPNYDNGTMNAITNPINCYLDVKVEFDTSKIKTVGFNMNYAGYSDSHNCSAITEETDALDTGIYGEKLVYRTFTLNHTYNLFMPDENMWVSRLNVAGMISASKLFASDAEITNLTGYAKTGLSTAIPILGLNKDDSSFGNFGFKTTTAGTGIVIAAATNSEIRAATNNYKSIVPANFKYAFDHHSADLLKRIEALEAATGLNKITFTIQDPDAEFATVTFEAEKGMSWAEFAKSDYSKGEFKVEMHWDEDADFIVWKDAMYPYLNGEKQEAYTGIVDGAHYTTGWE